MAVILETEEIPTSWNRKKDAEIIQQSVEKVLKQSGSGSVFFVSEAHNIDFDIERREILVDYFKTRSDVVIVIERGLFQGTPPANAVVEPSSSSSPADDIRNSTVVNLLRGKLSLRQGVTTILFFFGGQHEDKIKPHVEKKLPESLRIRWVSCKSITDHIAKEKSSYAAQFSVKGMVPAGYIEYSDTNPDYRLLLLQKGLIREPFNIELCRQDEIWSKTAFAIYFRDKALNAKYRREADEDGSTTVQIARLDGADIAVAKLIQKQDIKLAESGALT